MMLPNRFKPKFKKLIHLKENIQNYAKIIRFRKKKWIQLIKIYKKKLKLYNKIKPKDYSRHLVSRYTSISFAYKKKYKNILQETTKFKLTYGNFRTKKIKNILKNKFQKINVLSFLKLFENRLDVILYRAKFVITIRQAVQLIYQGKVYVNNKIVKIKSYILKPGDVILIKSKYLRLIKLNVLQLAWPVCQKHLIINYKTLQIICDSWENNISLNLFYNIDFEKILTGYYQY